ncbi:cytochrome P450 [Laetiporus sulphureus 93-53]|uniref:Cytochrome P450 n=1 Tax=Laetiporus sulphureus 93-53 TaxID=1314785 RepID=A0A165CPV0_9APHY|nr:cytochrome P450 [Laetiporus sulphureus 93-53]KZT03202.1 cytochrome P450 [Laetiporus sulphureus 93-53]
MAAGREQSICLAIFLCFTFVYVVVTVANKRKRSLRMPPGPARLPLLGNAHRVPSQYQYYTFTTWARKYGEIVYARFFHQNVVILNTLRVAQELMEKRGTIYSDRPRFVILAELVRIFHPNYSLMPYGDEWRRQRKWAQTTVQARSTLESYRPLQQREVRSMLSDLIQAPENFAEHISKHVDLYVASVLMEILYGITATSSDGTFIRMSHETISGTLDLGGAGSSLADLFPILQYIPSGMPGAGFKRKALKLRRAAEEVVNLPFERVKTAMSSGTAKTSFVRRILEETSELATNVEDERRIKASAALMYEAMVLYPDVYRKAQIEMDAVVGRSRLPNLDDRLVLPYLECVLKEVYRYVLAPTRFPSPEFILNADGLAPGLSISQNIGQPVQILDHETSGLPHAVLKGDQYRNYLIPGKSIVIANIWAMSRDPEIYTEADAFDNDRFHPSLPDTDDLTDPRKYIFGFGRRICPGRFLADSSCWLVAAAMVAAMDISKDRTSSGDEIDPMESFSPATVRRPNPFVCNIRLRSEKVAQLLSQRDDDGMDRSEA